MKSKDYRQRAWAALSNKWGTVVLAMLIVVLLSGAINGIPGVGQVASLILSGPLQLGFVIVIMKVLKDEVVDISNVFDGFKDFMSSFLLFLLNTIFVTLWSLLFVIPGIIAAYSYSMSYYILKDNPGMDANEARKASIEMMKGHKWQLFCLEFSFIGWIILSILTCGILTLWVGPYMETAKAAFYEELKANQNNY